MKTLFKTAGILALACMIILGSCKKDDKDNQPKQLTEEQMNEYATVSLQISTQMQASIATYLSKAFEMGFTGELPSLDGKKSGSAIAVNDYNWLGPDAQGWHYRTWEYLYKYTEKLRTRGDTVEHVYITEADGEYKFEYATQHIKYKKNNKEFYKGYTQIDINSFGYNDISRTFWRMDFKDWDISNGAGIFDWYWGVPSNLGGNTVRTHKYLHIEATPAANNWLHVRVIIYDEDGSEVWDFEYDTPFEPVDLS
jgi:hypothetical protein